MILNFVLVSLSLLVVATAASQLDGTLTNAPTRLRAGFLPPADARGVPVDGLDLSWEVPLMAIRGVSLTGYQAQVWQGASSVWDSGQKASPEPACVVTVPLANSTQYTWRVRAWVDNSPTAWSANATFITQADAAVWTSSAWVGGYNALRTNFTLPPAGDAGVVFAVLHATAAGAFEASINGKPTDNTILNPGQSVYTSRTLYTTSDVTAQVKPGTNILATTVGNYKWGYLDAWCNMSAVGADGCRAVNMVLLVTLSNGTTLTFGTRNPAAWVGRHSGTFYDHLYHGEQCNSQMDLAGWDANPLASFPDGTFFPAHAMSPVVGPVTPQRIPYIRETTRLQPVSKQVFPGADGNATYVYDFGQNMAGVTEITVTAAPGTTITLKHTEILYTSGRAQNTYYPCSKNPWNCANQTDAYTTHSSSSETWTPTYTQHGFRYVEVTASPSMSAVSSLSVVARMFNTNVTVVGGVSLPSVSGVENGTENLLNRMQNMVVSGQRSQLMSIPTDCPQREKRGWMADAQLSSNEAMLNFDMQAFYRGWLRSIRDDQLAGCATTRGFNKCSAPTQQYDGSVSDVEPSPYIYISWPGDPTWQVAYIVIARNAFAQYADITLLEDNFAGLQAQLEYFQQFVNPNSSLLEFGNLGDWPPKQSHLTPIPAVSAFYYVLAIQYMADMAAVLGLDAQAAQYSKDHAAAVSAYHTRFFNATTGGYSSNSQTANLMALQLNTPPPDVRPRVVSNLVDSIVAMSNHVDIGIVGTTWVFDVLVASGQDDLAFDILMHDAHPSFGYMLANGATTPWESWDGTRTTASGSRNHVMFIGSLGQMTYNHIAGVATVSNTTSSGWRDIVFRAAPAAFKRLPYASAAVHTRFGEAAVSWASGGGAGLSLNATVPVGSRATCWLPANASTTILEGGAPVWSKGVFIAGTQGVSAGTVSTYANGDAAVVLSVGAGAYHFEVAV